jgi:hypothetical protein
MEKPFDKNKLIRERDRLIAMAIKEEDKAILAEGKLANVEIQAASLREQIENAELHCTEAMDAVEEIDREIEDRWPTPEQRATREAAEREAREAQELEAFANEIVLMPAGPTFNETDWEWKAPIEGATVEVLRLDQDDYQADLAERVKLLERQKRNRRAAAYEHAIARPPRDFRWSGSVEEKLNYEKELEENRIAYEERQAELTGVKAHA